MTRRLSLVMLCLLVAPSAAWGGTLFVSTTGSDRNPGSIGRPLRTISRAARLAQPGDTVLVRGGTYAETVLITVTGRANARLTFRPYEKEEVIIDGAALPRADLVQITDSSFVTFSGFKLRNSKRIGISVWGGQAIALEYNEVTGAVKGGIWVGHEVAGRSGNITIAHNKVTDTVLENRQRDWPRGGWSQAIGVYKSRNVTVSNNYVMRNYGEGIVFVVSDYGVARQNEVFDNFSFEVYLDNAQSITIDGNLLYSTGDRRFYRRDQPPAGIGMANERYDLKNPLYDITITNNIVVNGRWGVYYGSFERGGGLHTVRIANNTFHGATEALVQFDQSSHTAVTVENNIFSSTGGRLARVAGNLTFRSNNWSGGDLSTAQTGAGDVNGDPRFARPGGITAAGYALRPDSPLRDRGRLLSYVTHDYWGERRAAAYDIGADELPAAPAVIGR